MTYEPLAPTNRKDNPLPMDYLIARRFNTRDLLDLCGPDPARIRRHLQNLGLTFAAANCYALFTVYGFTLPNGKPTLLNNLINHVEAIVYREDEFLPMTPN